MNTSVNKKNQQNEQPVCANMDLVNTLRVSISMIYAISTVPGTLYGCHRDLVNRYRISVSQIRKYEIFSITTNTILHWSGVIFCIFYPLLRFAQLGVKI
jgi:hypothetical protein